MFQGEEASFDERDVIWGQNGKETVGDWTKVVPVQGPLPPLWDQKGPKKPPPVPVPPVSRPSRLRPPPPSSSSSSSSPSSGASSSSDPAEIVGEASGEDRGIAEPAVGGGGGAGGVEGAMTSGGGGGSGDGIESSSPTGVVNLGARSVSSPGKRPALASRGSANATAAPGAAAGTAEAGTAAAGEGLSEREGGGDGSDAAHSASGSDAAASAASTGDAEAAASASDVDSEGSFVLLVLEGSITAEYGLDEEEKERQARELSDGSGAVTRRGKPIRKVPPRSRKDRVLGKGAPHDSMGWGVESVPIGRGYRGWIGV